VSTILQIAAHHCWMLNASISPANAVALAWSCWVSGNGTRREIWTEYGWADIFNFVWHSHPLSYPSSQNCLGNSFSDAFLCLTNNGNDLKQHTYMSLGKADPEDITWIFSSIIRLIQQDTGWDHSSYKACFCVWSGLLKPLSLSLMKCWQPV